MNYSKENLLKATIRSLKSRFKKGLLDLTAYIDVFAKEAPDTLKKEWKTFQEEVIKEAGRLEKESGQDKEEFIYEPNKNVDETIQEAIDRLRSKVTQLSKKIEASD